MHGGGGQGAKALRFLGRRRRGGPRSAWLGSARLPAPLAALPRAAPGHRHPASGITFFVGKETTTRSYGFYQISPRCVRSPSQHCVSVCSNAPRAPGAAPGGARPTAGPASAEPPARGAAAAAGEQKAAEEQIGSLSALIKTVICHVLFSSLKEL